MDGFLKPKVDLSAIPGPYRIFGLFLLVSEGLLGFWFYIAESTTERISAGISMTFILGIFLFFILKVRILDVSGPSIPKKFEDLLNDELKHMNSHSTNLENQLNKEREDVKSLTVEKSKCENENQKMKFVIAMELDDENLEKFKERGIL